MLRCTMQAACQPGKPFNLWGFFRSTAADARYRAIFPHQDGALLAIAVQQYRLGDVGSDPTPFVISSLSGSAVRTPDLR